MLGKADGAQRKVAMAQMQNFETALDTFRLDVGRYPENLSELRVSNRRGWDGPYLPKKLPMDPWNNPYVYEVPGDDGQPYMLKSLAKDGLEGGTEDNKDIFHQ
jgi:general secretion pathway protein G